MQVSDYLERIRVDLLTKPDLHYLRKLQKGHLLAVPFENLDVVRGVEIVLNEELLFEKIVEGNRGGFCYELNGLFCWLLRQLGFSVSRVSGRVFDAGRGDFGPEYDHMVLLVHLNDTYVVDVGFGDSFRAPIQLPDGKIQDVSGNYSLVPLSSSNDEFILQQHEGDQWKPQYRFDIIPRKMEDFNQMCLYHQTSSKSSFTQRSICTLATPAGRITLSDSTLTITAGDRKRKLAVSTAKERQRILREHFGISLERWHLIDDQSPATAVNISS